MHFLDFVLKFLDTVSQCSFMVLHLYILRLEFGEVTGQLLELRIEPVQVFLVLPLECLYLALLALQSNLYLLFIPPQGHYFLLKPYLLLRMQLFLAHEIGYSGLQFGSILNQIHFIVFLGLDLSNHLIQFLYLLCQPVPLLLKTVLNTLCLLPILFKHM